VFEDLVKEKKIPIEKQIERCPYCGSYLIQKNGMKYTIDDRWVQKVVCRWCTEEWFIVYNESKDPVHILKYKKVTK